MAQAATLPDIGYGPGIRAPDADSGHGVKVWLGSDQLSPADQNALVSTVAGEGANQPPLAQQYIASTILNRAKLSGKSIAEIASDTSQYNGANNKVAQSATPGSNLHNQVLSNIGPVLENGPIASVTHFINPTLQAKEGVKYPAWGNGGDGVKVGDQVYFDRSKDIAKDAKGSPSDGDFVNAANGNTAPTTTSSGPSDQDFVNAANTFTPPTGSQPQSPGVQAALGDMNAKDAIIRKTFNIPTDQNSSSNALLAGGIQGLTANTVPLIGGALAGLHTGINNFLAKHFGVGTPTSYGMGDAFSAARQIGSNQLNATANAHPILSAVGNTAGFLGSPVLKGFSAAVAPARAALTMARPALATAGRIGLGALETGAAGAAAGAGQAASDGGTPSQIGESALTYGAPSALGGMAGEALAPVLSKGAAALVGHNAHPAAKVAARVGAHALGGAAVGGLIGGLTGGVKGAEAMAAMGAGFGSTGGIKEAKPVTEYSLEHAQTATEHLARTVSPNLDEAAEHFENSPHPTTAEATGEHTSKLLTTATQSNSNSVGSLKANVAERQNQTEVKKNLTNAVNKAIGGDVVEAGNNVEQQIVAERNAIKEESHPENLNNRTLNIVNATTGIHPAEAEMNVDNYLESKKNSPLWQKVDANKAKPVTTPEHDALLHNEPVVRTALAQAQRDLGPEGSTTNPNFKPNENEKTAKNLTSEDISEYFKNGPVGGRNFNQIDPQEIADYHNNKNNPNSNEPETVPTQKAWILAERYLGRSVPRNTFGKVDYSNPSTVEIQNSQQDVNAANKQHFEGLKEAKAESGETFSFERAKDLGNNLSDTKSSETPEAFAKRYSGLSDPEKEATQQGYLQEFYRKLQKNPIAASNEYSNPIHQKFQKAMFGVDGVNAIQDAFEHIKTTKQQSQFGGPIEQSYKVAADALKSGDQVKFNEAYDKATPEQQQAYGELYKIKLAKAINNINANGGAVEEKHLKELNNFVTDEGERATQDKIFGKDKADQLRSAITKQVELAKSGSEVSKFSSASKAAEKDHDTVQAGALGFVSHGLHGALKGVGITSALKSTGHVLEAVKQGRMTPEAQQALADKLAQSPQQTAQDIRDLKARKENMPMSKSTIIPKATKNALTGLGYLTGRTVHNAFSGSH